MKKWHPGSHRWTMQHSPFSVIFCCNSILKHLKQKLTVVQMLTCPHSAPFSLLFCGCDFNEVSSVTSASRCHQHRAWWGELAERAFPYGLCPCLSRWLEPWPWSIWSISLCWFSWLWKKQQQRNSELLYKAIGGQGGLNEYLQSTLRTLNERSYKNARCYYLFMKVLWLLANSMNCWHLIIETVCLSDPLW